MFLNFTVASIYDELMATQIEISTVDHTLTDLTDRSIIEQTIAGRYMALSGSWSNRPPAEVMNVIDSYLHRFTDRMPTLAPEITDDELSAMRTRAARVGGDLVQRSQMLQSLAELTTELEGLLELVQEFNSDLDAWRVIAMRMEHRVGLVACIVDPDVLG